MFDSGISTEGDLIDLATEDDIVNKSGSWFAYNDVRLGQGRENSKQFLRDNPELYKEIEAAVIAKRRPSNDEDAPPHATDKPGKSATLKISSEPPSKKETQVKKRK